METQEILLINAPEKTEGFVRDGYKASNYGKLSHALEALNNRVICQLKQPSLALINVNKIDSSEYKVFKNQLDDLRIDFPVIILDDTPTAEKMQAFRKMGAGDYLQADTSIDIIKMQFKRLAPHHKEMQAQDIKIPSISLPKRIIDVVLSSGLLLMLSPLLLLVIVAIRLESRGSVFYWQPRVGTGYKIFKFYKFRSMRVDADQMLDAMASHDHYSKNTESGEVPQQVGDQTLIGDDQVMPEDVFIHKKNQQSEQSFKKFENDPRITRVGRWIRKTSIDELPQLINVIKGDMSLVGNRPLPLYEAESLTSDEWAERFMAPAGITGLWQVTERGKKSTSIESRKRLDNEYARRNNLAMDMKILLKTPLAAIQQENV